LLVLPELLLVSHSENWLTEDGSNRIQHQSTARPAAVEDQIEMALGHPGHACPAFPVPFRLADSAPGGSFRRSRSAVWLLAEP